MVEIFKFNNIDVITTSEGLNANSATDDGYGEIIDLDDFGL